MRVGFRNVDSQEMEGSPLFEVRPANPDVEQALLEDRVAIQFGRTRDAQIVAFDRYWLDTGVFEVERA